MSKFPDFIIVGAMKCGTTVLWHNLNKHPNISMGKNPDDPKKASTEIRFWNDGHPHFVRKKGIDWYKNLFTGKCSGEKCANYIDYEKTMKDISKNIPDVKIILCIREPVERIISEYNMQKDNLKYDKLYIETVKDRGYIRRSSYYDILKNKIFPFFDKKQVYIIIQERMKKDTNAEINKIYDFLELPHHTMKNKEISAKYATSRTLDLEKDKNIKSYKVWESDKIEIPKTTRLFLERYFTKPNKKLFNLIGEIPEWGTP